MRSVRLAILTQLVSLWIPAMVAAQPAMVSLSQIEREDFPQVQLYLEVLNEQGAPVTGLTQSMFKVFEDGRAVEIYGFLDPTAPQPLTTVLVLDRSGSMTSGGKLDHLKKAVLAYIEQMRSIDTAAIIVFDSRVEVTQDRTADRRLLSRAIEPLSARGQTAFYDAVVQALRVVRGNRGHQAIVALTDGMDNSSRWKLAETVQEAKRNSVPVYTIGLGVRFATGRREEGVDEGALTQLARETGGDYFYAPSGEGLKQLYEHLANRLRTSYVIGYQTPRPILDGTERRVVVRLESGQNGREAWKGYYVPGLLVPAASGSLFLTLLVPLLGLLVLPIAVNRAKQIPGLMDFRWLRRSTSGSTEALLTLIPETLLPDVVRIVLRPGTYAIGSDPSCDVVIRDPSISPRHLQIDWSNGLWVVADCNSKTGTFLRYHGQTAKEWPVRRNAVKTGSLLKIGSVSFRLQIDETKRP